MSKYRLLIIDDDDAGRRMLRRVLERRGYSVDEADNGLSGLERIFETSPDGVLLDLRMPGEMSGFDVAAALRADERTKDLTLIVVSASTHLDAKELVAQLGCDAFVEKPVDFEELSTVLKQLLPEK